MADELGGKKKALAGGTLLAAIVWEAVKAGEIQLAGGESDKLRALEEQLRAGTAALAIYLERSGAEIYLAATLVRPAPASPFSGTVLELRGPVVSSIAELEALALQAAPGLH